jgi:hypothetical protein
MSFLKTLGMAALAATFWLAHSQFAGRNRAAVNKKPAKTQVASTVHFFEPERPKDPIEPKEIWVYTQNYTFNGAKVVVENQDGKKVQGQLPLLANMSTAHQAHLVMSSPGNMRDGEYLEITPKNIRLRKKFLTELDRARSQRKDLR